MKNKITLVKRQSGVVLVVSLIMLLLLTLIGITGTQVTSMEEKMAGNMRNSNLAFQSAESALRAGESFLTQAALPTFTAAGTNGLYSETAAPLDVVGGWAALNSVSYPANTLTGVAAAPEYLIQQLASVGGGAGSSSLDASSYTESGMYQVTAQGVGGTTTAVAVVRSYYRR